MRAKVGLEDAVARVKDDDHVSVGGCLLSRTPMALMREILRHRRRGLTLSRNLTCNEGELFTYAEALYDRIIAGDSKDKLYAYLSEVQVDHLEMAKSDEFRAIVDRAVELSGRSL